MDLTKLGNTKREQLIKYFLKDASNIYDIMSDIKEWEQMVKEAIVESDIKVLEFVIKNKLYRDNPPLGESITALIAKYNPNLLEGAVSIGLDIGMNNGDALFEVLVDGNLDVAQELIDLGISVDVDNSYIISWALNNNSLEAAKLLEKNGIDFSKSGIDLNRASDMSQSEYLAWASNYDSFQDALASIFGNVTSNLSKKIYEKIYEVEGQPNTKLINFFKLIKEIRPDINRDNLINMIPKKWDFDYRTAPVDDLIMILEYYNDKRVAKLLQKELLERHYIADSARTLQKIKEALDSDNNRIISEEEIKENLPSKPKDFKEIHDAFVLITRKIKQANYKLGQESLSHINNEKIGDLKIWIPEYNHDLIEVGNSMNICVGNGWYAERVKNKEINIIILQKSGKNHVCFEYTNGKIAQSKMNSNNPFKDGEVKSRLLELIRGEK